MTVELNYNSWVLRPKPNRRARLRLFCLPYAGGGVSIYRTWPDLLPADVESCHVQLPGRGSRMSEPPFTRLFPLVQTLAQALLPYLDMPFAFFGHSMGALIGFELARHLRRQHDVTPNHLFVSGFRAAQIPDPGVPTHHLPDLEFLTELRRLGGTPDLILRNAELMRLMLPTVRADVALCETYTYLDEAALDCPITAFGGLQDILVNRDDLTAWGEQTHTDFTMRMFDGDHFFINSDRSHLVRAVSETLARLLSRASACQRRNTDVLAVI